MTQANVTASRRDWLRLASGAAFAGGAGAESKSRADIGRLPPVSVELLRRLGKRQPPEWLRCPRFYTMDNRRDINPVSERKAGDIARLVHKIADNQGTVFRLAVYWGGEVFYQSRFARHAPGLRHLDLLREAVDTARERGVRLFAYMNPRVLWDDHPLYPECTLYDASGKPWDVSWHTRQMRFACTINPKYRQYLLDIIGEIFTEYGPDGLYVDGLTCNICFCPHCRRAWHARFGQEMPAKLARFGPAPNGFWELADYPIPLGDIADPDWQHATEHLWKNEADLTRAFTETVKKAKADALTFYHNMPKPDTEALYDCALSEVVGQRPWVHTLWQQGELANYSGGFTVPLVQNVLYQGLTPQQVQHRMFQAIGNGVYPNVFFHLPRDDSFAPMKEIFGWMRDHAAELDFTRVAPVRYLALVRARHPNFEHRGIAQAEGGMNDYQRFMQPYVGMFAALLRQSVPVVTLRPSRFEQRLAGFRVLCLAGEACLSPAQVDAVRRFVEAGGGLLATGEIAMYDQGKRRHDSALADVLGVRITGIQPAGKGGSIHPVGEHAITKGVGTIAYGSEPHLLVQPAGAEILATLRNAGGEVPAVLTRQFGKGRVVYLPGRLDAMECEVLDAGIERLIANAVRWAAGGCPVEIASAGVVGATLFDQPGRRLLHLINYTADSQGAVTNLRPLSNLRIRVEVAGDAAVKRLRAVWSGAEIRFSQQGRVLEFPLARLESYELISAEYA